MIAEKVAAAASEISLANALWARCPVSTALTWPCQSPSRGLYENLASCPRVRPEADETAVEERHSDPDSASWTAIDRSLGSRASEEAQAAVAVWVAVAVTGLVAWTA